MPKPADLNECSHPDEIPDVLRRAARYAAECAGELDSAWQDNAAGEPWETVSRELERAAERIEKRLGHY